MKKTLAAAMFLFVAVPAYAQVTIETPGYGRPYYGDRDRDRGYYGNRYRDYDRGRDYRYGRPDTYRPRRYCYYAGGVRVCQ